MNVLFLENSYLKEFETKIIGINNDSIILEETAFYSKSGGQPGDIGKLIINEKQINILNTSYDDNKNILHFCESTKELKVGNLVKGIINWDQRYKHMRMHTALHLLCSIIPYDVTGGQITSEKSRLDFNAENKINKDEIQNKIQLLISQDHKVSYQWISSKELDNQPELIRTMSVKPPRTNNKIRLVKIGNVDLQPCGGTHVKSTKEIGNIIIGKVENKGKINKRVNLLFG